MSEKCKIDDCNKEILENELCIFHCPKDTWYKKEKNYKFWKRTLVEKFWENFYQHIKTNNNCKYFIFPEMDYYIENYSDAVHQIHLSHFKLEKLDFSKTVFLDGLAISNSKIIDCKFDQSDLKSLNFFACEIEKCSFHGVKFSHGYLDGNIISDSSFPWLDAKEISFAYSKVSNINLNNSYIEMLDLQHAHITDSSFQNITVKSGNKHTFRVLKTFFESIADNINANYYYSREMQEYCKEVVLNPYFSFKNICRNIVNYFKHKDLKEKRRKHIYSSIKNFFADLIIFGKESPLLMWNYIVSNYGQSWILPLIWLFLVSYGIFKYIHLDISFDINEFAMFLNPFLKNTDKYQDFYALWLLHKLLESIFIYHFIVAVRRKTNKK